MRTIGISPKVAVPVVGQVVVGVILLLTGDTVEGKTLLVTALGTLAAGFGAKPGRVVTK